MQKKLKNFLNNYDIDTNKVSANFLLLIFKNVNLEQNIFMKN